jgi:WD40 repeat protein
MSVDATILPQDVLGYIFSYLNPEDLGRAACVCRGWNSTSSLEWVCRNVARSILDLSEPSRGSWKEQCSILRRWKAWKPQEVPLSSCHAHGMEEFYVLLEDKTALEVVQPDSSRRSLFSVRNLFNHEELRQINVQQYGCADIFGVAVHGTMWTIRDTDGKIFQFDIKTGGCINQFIGEAVQDERLSDIYSNDYEIIVSVQNRVQIWDLQQRRLSQTFTIEEGWEIWRTCSTPNFVLFLARQSESLVIFAVNKKDPKIQTRIEVGLGAELYTFKSYGSYCSLLIGGELHVYEDTPDAQFQLVRTHRVQEAPGGWNGTVQVYRNWVCVHKDDAFCIFDVRSGKEVLSLKKDWGLEVRFRVKAQAMLVFHMFGATSGFLKSTKLCLYDFSGRVQQQSSSGRCSTM